MPHRTNPQYGANLVDRYIGSAFDIVYGVYKELNNLAIVHQFAADAMPLIEQAAEQSDYLVTKIDEIDEAVLTTASNADIALTNALSTAADALSALESKNLSHFYFLSTEAMAQSIEGQAVRAEQAADLAADAVGYEYWVDLTADLANIEGAVEGNRAFVRQFERVYEYVGNNWVNRGSAPTALKENKGEPRIGYIATATGSGLSVDTTAQTITLTGRVTIGRKSFLLPDPVVLPYALGPSQIISVSVEDGTALLTAATAVNLLPDSHAILGTLRPASGTITGVGGEYFIDGYLYEPANTEAKTGYVSSSSGPGISVDTVAKTVTIQGRLTSGPRTKLISTPQVLPYSGGTALIISVSLATGEGLLSPTNISTPLPREHVILGTLSTGNGRISGAGGEYILDGQHYMPPITIPNDTATADFWGQPSDVEIDTTARTITFSSGVRISDGRRTRLSNASVIDYTDQTGTFFIVIDDSTGDPRLVPSNQLQNTSLVTPNDFILGVFRTGTGKISGLVGGFTRNGEVYEAESPTSSGPVIPEKTPENADFWGTPSSVQVDTVAKTITFPGGGRINAGRRSRVMPAYTIDYSSESGTFFVVIHESSGNPRLVPGNQIQNNALITPDDLILGQFRTSNGALSGFPGGYTLDGVEYLPDAPISYLSGEFYSSVNGGGITVDTTAKTITFSGWIVAGGFSASLSSVVYNYSGIASQSGWRYLTYNKTSGSIGIIAASSLATLSSDRVVFLVFRPSELDFRGTTGGYTIDGVVYSTVSKESFLNGTLHTSSSATAVSFDTSTNTITFNGLIVADNFAATLSNVQYNYTGNQNQGGWRYLTYNTSTGGIGITTASTMANLPAGRIVFMAVRFSTLDVQGIPGPVVIDGTYVGGLDRNYGVTLSDASSLNIDFIEKTIEISSVIQVLHRGYRLLVPPQTVDFSGLFDTVWGVVVFDPKTEEVTVQAASQRYGHLMCILGAIKVNTESVVGFGEYAISGNARGKRPTWRDRPVSLGWDLQGDFTCPVLPGHSASDPLPTSAMVTEDIYDLYDELVDEYPEYITKTLLGNDASGLLPIYEYRFKPPFARTAEFEQGDPEHLRVLILALHSEQINYIYPFYLMKLICENWATDPILEAFRWGVEWSVVPALNPYAVDNKQRPNFNGVDLNRNFPARWQLSGAGGDFYSGPTPMSEPETQYAYALLKEFSPHLVVDCHSFGSKAAPIENTMFWWATEDDKTRAVVGATINRLARKWQEENNWMPPANELGYTVGTVGAGLFRTTALSLGATTLLYEAAWSINSEPGGPVRGSPLTVRYTTEGIGNCVLNIIRAITQ